MNKKEQHKLTENVGEVMFIRALIVNKAETFTFSAFSVNSPQKLFGRIEERFWECDRKYLEASIDKCM